MRFESELDIINLIERDDWMMEILKTVSQLDLPDWWVCAGFVRSKIWDTVHGFNTRTPLSDVDVIYYDDTNIWESAEKKIETTLHDLLETVPWSAKNEARMHIVNMIEPYTSSADAIEKFPETATALGVTLDKVDKVILLAPHGIEDAVKGCIRPTPYFKDNNERMAIFEKRLNEKKWDLIWPQITFPKKSTN